MDLDESLKRYSLTLKALKDARPQPSAEQILAVPAGAPSGLTNGYPQVPEPSLVRFQSLVGNTRGSTDPLIPYIVSPRATKLLNPKPILSWNPVPGVEGYTRRISGTEWQERANTTKFVYPGNPPLQPGQDYLLVVESNNGKSSKDEGIPGLRSSLLPEEEAQRVRADAATIHLRELSGTANTFAVSQIYAGHALYAEAIEMLEGPANDSQAASVHGALGELYQQVGLLMLAESSYSRASALAKAIGDVKSAAPSQDKLGEIYMAFGNKKRGRSLVDTSSKRIRKYWRFTARRLNFGTVGRVKQISM